MKKSNPTLYWVHCPVCHNKTRTKVREDTVLINFPLYCSCMPSFLRKLNTTLVNVVRLKKVVCEP